MSATETIRQESRARWPEGHCAEHTYQLAPEDWGCKQCLDRESAAYTARQQRKDRIERVTSWFSRSALPCNLDDLGVMPGWSGARFSNTACMALCNQRLVTTVRGWDLTTWLALFAGTGDGKSALLVAKMHELRERSFAAAEAGPMKPPPLFLYTTGYELGESNKRRRLGQDQHALIAAAMTRPLLLLDEVHPSHTPGDVLFAVLDARTKAALPTVITSGMSAVDFGEKFGVASLRRATQGKWVDTFPSEQKVRAIR